MAVTVPAPCTSVTVVECVFSRACLAPESVSTAVLAQRLARGGQERSRATQSNGVAANQPLRALQALYLI